jgi:hypothetical protein
VRTISAITTAAALAALAALAIVASAGCANRAPASPAAAPSPGTLRLWVRERVGWPIRLEGVHLTLDGERVDAGPAPSVVAGVHTLVARVQLRWPCALGGESGRASMTEAYALQIGLRGADLEVEVVTRGSAANAPETRPELHARASGDAELTEWHSGAALEAEAARRSCARVAEPDAAVCRVRVAVEGAKARRDVVDHLCKQDKLAQLEAYAKILKDSQARSPHGPFDDARERVARQRIVEVEAEAWQCLGEELVYLPRVSVEHACTGELPDPWKD